MCYYNLLCVIMCYNNLLCVIMIYSVLQVTTNMILSILSAALFCPALITLSVFAAIEAVTIHRANAWGSVDGVGLVT